ncbi:histidine kinase [Aquimarina sp. RZ0]|uniref:tetratricopeptide repeat-containing sensor histidine kinase n=1 Tax=Aquimarina sp. RZ0 TaxID=2607730 RepID=UPI0011F1AFBA|nr:histidine kinase [Aquimarina sp. RZ0]KAA1247629.1 hypothetical protein F0000_02140 [Aquimarina sp. RZ0]
MYKIYTLLLFLILSISANAQASIDKELHRTINLENNSLNKIIQKADSLAKAKNYPEAELKYDMVFDILRNTYGVDSLEKVDVKKIGFKIERFFTRQMKGYLKSMDVLDFIENYCDSNNDYKCLAQTNIRLGILHKRIGEYLKSLDYYNKSLSYAEKIDDAEIYWSVFMDRGGLFLDIGDLNQARKDFKKSLSYIPLDNLKKKGLTYTNISASFVGSEADSILYYSKLASLNCTSSSSTRRCTIAYNNIAWAYFLKDMPGKALEVIRNNIDLEKLTYKDSDELYPALLHTLGSIEYKLEKYDKALSYFLDAHKGFLEKNDILDLIRTKEDLSRTYEKMGNLKSSIKILREIKPLRAGQLKVKISKELAKNEGKKLLEVKEKIISHLEEKNLKIEKEVSKTKWLSYTLGILLCVALIVLVYRGYKGKIRYYQMNEQLTLTRLTSLRSSMNPHFLFNTFSTLQNYILKNDNLRANEYMTELSGLIRNVLKSSDSVYIHFNDELNIIQSYVNLQRGRFQEKFDVVYDIEQSVIALNPKIPSMIIQPFIENAIIHGFSHLSKKGELKISLKLINEALEFRIVDNGIGRAASEALKKETKDKSHLSIATENTIERLEILNKIVEGYPNVIINDLFCTLGEPKGTEVVITLPIIKEIRNNGTTQPEMLYNR